MAPEAVKGTIGDPGDGIPTPPPPRRVSRSDGAPSLRRDVGTSGILDFAFAAKGIITAVSAIAMMAVMPWVTSSLRTAIAESGATLPRWTAWMLDRTWILYVLASLALVSGICMAFTRRGRWMHLAVSTVALVCLVLFLGLCLLTIVRSVADVATGS